MNDIDSHRSSEAPVFKKAAREAYNIGDGTVTLLTHSYLDAYTQNITRPFGGGLERYIHALCQTISAMGLRPVVYQLSYYGAFDTIHEGVRVRGFTYTFDQIGPAFEEMAAEAEGLIIYASCIWQPIRYLPLSIGICHGISWDRHDMPLQDKQTIASTIQSAVSLLDRLVSVDSQFLTYCRSVCEYGDSERIVLLPNSVDTQWFAPEPDRTAMAEPSCDSQQPQADAIRILFPRRLSFERGIVPMMLVTDAILQEFPAAVVEFAGELVDNTTMALAFRLWQNSHPHKDRIEQKTYSFEQMRDAYLQADLAVIPTIFSEGTSLACLEAMSCGLPVVSSNVGGLNDIVIDGLNGLLVAPRSTALLQAVRRLIRDAPLRKTLGAAARQTALAFDERKWRQSWTSIIQEQLHRLHGG